MKKNIKTKKPLVCITAYNKFTAEIADSFCDMILVGDSLGMAYYGDDTTRNVSLTDMIRHGSSVRKGTKKAFLVIDMPYGTYNSIKEALRNAKLIIRKTKCDAIKIEGGSDKANIIKFLTKKKIKVVGHIGLLPQRVTSSKKYNVKGKSMLEKRKLIKDFLDIEKAGAISVVLEAIKLDVANEIIQTSKIPVIGIGASHKCHGQILVMEDLLGFFDNVPKFVKKYGNLKLNIKNAIKKYSLDVKNRKFPSKKNIY